VALTPSMREWAPIVTYQPPPSAARPAFDASSLAAAVEGRLISGSARPITGAAVDSRRVEPGNAFFALPGERTDGHNFVAHALSRGAAALVVSRDLAGAELGAAEGADAGVVRVADGLQALQRAASAWRARFDPLVVAITGSLAKTMTKEQTAELLSERWHVLRNAGNENNEIGLPLTLLRLAPEHQVAVLEMGMYVEGDIAALAALAQPTIGVVTAVRATHLSRAGSLDAIEAGKRELVEAIPSTGTVVLNVDDPRVASMAAVVRGGVRLVRYGFSDDADVSAHDVESRAEQGMHFVLRAGGQEALVETPALGRHSVHNALAAAAVGVAAGLDMPTIVRGLRRPFGAPHRTTLLDLGGWRVLDDSYNAAPDSMIAALDLLASLPGRRVAVLGEMLELGEGAAAAHRQVGGHAARTADLLIAIGAPASDYAAAARAAGLEGDAVFEVADRDRALALLVTVLRPGDVVLVKASRGIELDLLVEGLQSLATESVAT
jgi:UDP-N-acetylmuramoyl-tripeptide--D-alanyl-D-alanine ligase